MERCRVQTPFLVSPGHPVHLSLGKPVLWVPCIYLYIPTKTMVYCFLPVFMLMMYFFYDVRLCSVISWPKTWKYRIKWSLLHLPLEMGMELKGELVLIVTKAWIRPLARIGSCVALKGPVICHLFLERWWVLYPKSIGICCSPCDLWRILPLELDISLLAFNLNFSTKLTFILFPFHRDME